MSDTALARRAWRTLEPIHGCIYFAPEAAAEYERVGVTGRSGYFASRSAPMGAVATEVVVATFYNFHPGLVRRSMAGVWDLASPATMLAARHRAADAVLRRLFEDDVDSDAMHEAASRAEVAARAACEHSPGRPLFAGHAGLDWPEAAHMRLWHAITLLREFRGDGHINALLDAGLSGVEALIVHGASGAVPHAVLKATRAWPDEEWAAAVDGLRRRGLLDADTGLTDDGLRLWHHVESRTDDLSEAPWAALGDDDTEHLRALARPWSRAVVAAGTFG